MEALFALLHHLAAFALVACLLTEWSLLRTPPDVARARQLLATDLAYGLCALLLLAFGAARVLWFGKGLDYYLGNAFFHAKLGAFLLMGLLSAAPTRTFLGWRAALRRQQVPDASPRELARLRAILLAELALVPPILLCAVLMARGHGLLD